MRGAILQPTYLSWLGYFEIISSTDIYVIFDHVQFERKSWQQRNRIKTPQGAIWLTIPVQKTSHTSRICDIKISYNNGNPLERHWEIIKKAYKKSPYFNKYKERFERIYSQKYIYLKDLDIALIKETLDILGIKTKIILSSELDLKDESVEKTEKVINLCKKTGITQLLDSAGAKDIFNKSLFKDISITFQDYDHPRYSQLWGKFIPYLSTIDLIFNEKDPLSIIKAGNSGMRADI